MDPAEHLAPALLFLAGTLVILVGVMVTRGTRGMRRVWLLLLCLVPTGALIVIGWYLERGVLLDGRKSAQLFANIHPGPDLTSQETEAFQVLAASSPRVREGVMWLAFANATNAARALPRLEILLHCAVRPSGSGEKRNEPERLWTRIVEPALRKRPQREIIFLAAATAALGKYDMPRAAAVLTHLHPLLVNETEPMSRAAAGLGLFAALAESASPAQVESAANLLLKQLLLEEDPMAGTLVLASFKLERSRLLSDLRRVTGRLSESAANRFADQVIAQLASQTNQSRAQALGWALEGVKSSLQPVQLDRAITNLIQQLPRSRGGVLQERAGPLVGLAEVLSSAQAAAGVKLLLDSLRQESDRWWHAELARALKALAPRLSEEDLVVLAEPMGTRAPEVVEVIRDRVPQEQAYQWMDRVIQSIIDTPNPTRRSEQVPRVAPLAARLTPERAGKLVDELWDIFLRDADESRRWDEAGCLVALVPRLSNEQVVSQAKLIVEQMQQPDSDLGTPVKLLTPFLGRCAPETAQAAVDCVIKRAGEFKPTFGSPRVQEREFLLGAPFTAAQKQILLEPLVLAFESHKDLNRYMGWVMALKPLTAQLAPDQLERVSNRLVDLYTQQPSSMAVSLLNSLATNVTMTSAQSKRIVEALLPRALECRMPDSDVFARCSGLFLSRLDPADAEATGTTVITAMARMREPMWAVLAAKCFVPLTPRLQPDAAQRLAEQLLQIPAHRGNHPGFASLLDSARPPEVSADWVLPTVFLERQEALVYLYRLEAWSRSLAAMLSRMDKNEARRFAEQVAARLVAQGRIHPMGFDEQTAIVLEHAGASAVTPVLQTPFGLGGLRHFAGRAQELQTGDSS